MTNNSNNQFEKINALRSTVSNIVADTFTLNQAVKALQGLEKKHADALEALGMESLTLKSICAAWADDLRTEDANGKKQLALYMSEQVTVDVTDPETGDVKPVNVYERKVNAKKGTVSFKSLKRRVLATPEKWTPALIVEGLVQSTELALAKLEAEVAELHVKNVMHDGVWRKVTEKEGDGSSIIRFEQM